MNVNDTIDSLSLSARKYPPLHSSLA